MIEVKVKRGSDLREVDKAMRNLKRTMDDEGILKDLKDRRHFIKPSDKKRQKSARARARARAAARANR